MINQGVILAGGKAKRMLPLSEHYEKVLLPAGERSILGFQIAEMMKLGVTEVFLVHRSNPTTLESALSRIQGIKIHLVEQGIASGIGEALLAVENHIHSTFVVFLGDTFFETTNIRQILGSLQNEASVLTAKIHPSPVDIQKNFSIELADESVVRVIEKPGILYPQMRQGCGVYIFDPEIFAALKDTEVSPLRGERELTDGIQKLIDRGSRVTVSDIFSFEMNVNSPQDLYQLNRHILQGNKNQNIISETAKIHPTSRISGSLICKDVIIAENCHIENCIVLDTTLIPAESTIQSSIVGAGFIYPVHAS